MSSECPFSRDGFNFFIFAKVYQRKRNANVLFTNCLQSRIFPWDCRDQTAVVLVCNDESNLGRAPNLARVPTSSYIALSPFGSFGSLPKVRSPLQTQDGGIPIETYDLDNHKGKRGTANSLADDLHFIYNTNGDQKRTPRLAEEDLRLELLPMRDIFNPVSLTVISVQFLHTISPTAQTCRSREQGTRSPIIKCLDV